MLLRPKSKEPSDDPDGAFVGDLEVVDEAVAESPPEKPSEAGAIAAISLAMFCVLRAFEFTARYGYTLRIAHDPGQVLDLRWVFAVHCILAAFLLLIAPRFAAWFAPRGKWRLGKLAFACLAFLLISLSVQPLTLAALGLPQAGDASNIFAGFLDQRTAGFAPAAVGAAILLILSVGSRVDMGAPLLEE